jgi:hypothetical protein
VPLAGVKLQFSASAGVLMADNAVENHHAEAAARLAPVDRISGNEATRS